MALLSRYNPWSALTDLERQMDQLMRGVFRGAAQESRQESKPWTPAVDVFTRDSDLVIRAEIPGVDPAKDIDITVADGVLRIRGQRRSEQRDEGANYFRMETSYGAFERSIPLPDGVNVDDIKAAHKNGVLEVVVPGAAQIAPARRIQVELGDESGGQEAIEAQATESAETGKGADHSAGAGSGTQAA
ncbi:MAG TPA: Hsp20/alpha crystallin family protein [Actinomycetota bacterium]|nr:Hsp20/alpha crystallin family protein [Actinomycetota bacterium]